MAGLLLEHIPSGADVIVAMANGEPVGLVDVLEEQHARLRDVRIHQMHALHRRPYIAGAYPGQLRHVSYFLAPATREAYWSGGCDLVPNHFSEMPHLLRTETRCSIGDSEPVTLGHIVLVAQQLDDCHRTSLAPDPGCRPPVTARKLVPSDPVHHRQPRQGQSF